MFLIKYLPHKAGDDAQSCLLGNALALNLFVVSGFGGRGGKDREGIVGGGQGVMLASVLPLWRCACSQPGFDRVFCFLWGGERVKGGDSRW